MGCFRLSVLFWLGLLVQSVGDELNRTGNTDAQGALLFALGGTDSRTLTATLPAVVRFVASGPTGSSLQNATRLLQRLMSSPDELRENADSIVARIGGRMGLEAIVAKAASPELKAALSRLQQLLC